MGLRNRTQLKDQQCFFVTTTCHNWLKLIDTDEAKTVVIDSLGFLCDKYNCHILGYVIMPNHIHMILYFPDKNCLSDFMRNFKKFTSVKLRHLVEAGHGETGLDSLRYEHREQKLKIWKDRFDDVCILNADILRTKLDYIHNNPLQPHWQLAGNPEDYPYSSAAFYEHDRGGPLKVTNFIEFLW